MGFGNPVFRIILYINVKITAFVQSIAPCYLFCYSLFMVLDVLCIGHAAYDIYFPLDTFPEENRKYKTGHFLESVGGPASNAAYLLGLWGVPAGFAGRVGEDSCGRAVLDDFRSVGVDTRLVEVREDFHTPLSCIINNRSNGSRTIINRREDSEGLRLDTAKAAYLDELAGSSPPRFLLFDSHEHEASLEALELFPRAVSVLDAGSARPASIDLAEKVTHPVCSESFAQSKTGIDRLERDEDLRRCAEMLRNTNPAPGAVTLGDRGFVYWDERGIYAAEPFRVKTVDTTGAGDIFHGAFVFALREGRGFAGSLVFAAAAAALSTEKQGGRESIPPLPDVRKLAERKKPAIRPL
jgi:sugar/nucleoside kinase (ribokinase family)